MWVCWFLFNSVTFLSMSYSAFNVFLYYYCLCFISLLYSTLGKQAFFFINKMDWFRTRQSQKWQSGRPWTAWSKRTHQTVASVNWIPAEIVTDLVSGSVWEPAVRFPGEQQVRSTQHRCEAALSNICSVIQLCRNTKPYRVFLVLLLLQMFKSTWNITKLTENDLSKIKSLFSVNNSLK